MCVVVAAVLLTAGCSTQAPWVNCEGRLEPINRPALKVVDEPVTKEPAKSEPIPP